MLSPRPWKLEAVLRLMIGVFLCLSIGTLVATLARGGEDDKSPITVRQLILSSVCFQGATIALVWRFVREHEMSWTKAFGLGNAGFRAVALGTLAACVFIPVAGLLQRISIEVLDQMGAKLGEQSAVEVLRSASEGAGLMAFVLITVVMAPLGEELLFRGVLYPAIKRAGFPRLALWGTSLLFATIHFNRPIFIPLLLLSLLLVWLYEYTDNFLAPLTAHALFNAANLVLFFVNSDVPTKLPAHP